MPLTATDCAGRTEENTVFGTQIFCVVKKSLGAGGSTELQFISGGFSGLCAVFGRRKISAVHKLKHDIAPK